MLNQKLIERCNNLSFFNSGSVIADEYEMRKTEFKNKYNNFEKYEPQQVEYLKEREKEWDIFITDLYNTYLNKRANFTPWFVAGRGNYDVKGQNKKLDQLGKFKFETLPEEIEKFYTKTEKQLKKLTSIEVELRRIREGGECPPIVTGTPHAKEKIIAKLEFCKELHGFMKKYNAHIRKYKTSEGFNFDDVPKYILKLDKVERSLSEGFYSFYLTNNNAEIKRLESRLRQIEKNENKETKEVVKSWGRILYNTEAERIQFLFNEKPSRDIIDLLKSKGFRWSPKALAWQRILNNNSIWVVDNLLKDELFS